MKAHKFILAAALLAVISNVEATVNNSTASQYVSMYINKTNREVFVMGQNYKGLLGPYSPNTSENYFHYSPLPTGILNAKSVVATAIKSYVLTQAGNVYVWGFDYVTRKSVSRPIAMPYKKVIDMAGTATQAAFIIDTDGDGKGSLVVTDFSKETQYPELQDAVQVSGGWNFFTVLKADGTVYTIGDNTKGQLGVGDKLVHAGVNRAPYLTSDVISISSGNYHTAVLHADGTVSTWGDNTDGTAQGTKGNTWYNALGYSTPTNTYLPNKVPGFSNIIELREPLLITI